MRQLQVLVCILPAVGLILAFEKARFLSLTTSPDNRFISRCAFSLRFIVSPTAGHGFSLLGFHGRFPKFPDRLRPL